MRRPLNLLTLAAGGLVLLEAVPYRPVVVSGISMRPTYESGSVVLATRRIGDLHRGDVVVARHDGQTIIKRVAFVGGDEYVQAKFADFWTQIPTEAALRTIRRRHWPERVVKVPIGYVYLVGDNAYESEDSRRFGPVALSDIRYKVLQPREALTGACFAPDGPGRPGYQPASCR